MQAEFENHANIEAKRTQRLDSARDTLESVQDCLDNLENMLAEEMKEESDSFARLSKAINMPQTQSGASTTMSRPINQSAGQESSWRPSTSLPPSQHPAKVPKSPAELEMLRLKDRLTLHRLPPS